MLGRIRAWLAPPTFASDEDKTRIASLLNLMLLLLFVIGLIFLPLAALAGGSYPGILIVMGVLVAMIPILLWMLRRGYVSLVSALLVSLLFIASIASICAVGTIRAPVASLFILCVVIAGLLIDYRGAVVAAVLSLVALLALWWAETADLLPPYDHRAEGFAPWVTLAALLVGAAVLVILATRGLHDSLERARRSEGALIESNRRLEDEVAERARAEEALRSSSEEHRQVVQNANEAIFVLQDGRFKLFNRKVLEITGYSRAELSSMALAELIHPNDRELVAEHYRRRLQGDPVPEAYDLCIVDKEGRTRWIETRAVVIDWGGGRATLNFASDVTERQQAEREREVLQGLAWELTAPLTLKALVKLLAAYCRTLFSYDSFRFDLYDEQDQMRNPIYAEDTPVGGQGPVDLETERSQARPPQVIQSVFDRQPVLVNRVEGPIADGLAPWGFAGRRSLSMMFAPVRWQGRCTGVIYTHSYTAGRYRERDLALLQMLADQCGAALARVQSDEALRQSEAATRALFEAVPDTIFRLNREGIFLTYKPAEGFESIAPPNEFIGKEQDEVLPPALVRQTKEAMERVLQTGKPQSFEYTLASDGEEKHYEARLTMCGEDQVMVLVRDITERRRAERLLQALNEAALAMEQALTKDEIFAAVAGQFRKLGLGCAVLVADESKSQLLPRYHSYEAVSVEAVQELLGLEAQDPVLAAESAGIFAEVVRERKTILVEGESAIRQMLPEPLRRFAGQVAEILRVPRLILAPLIVEEEVIGLLTVQAGDLVAGDIPAITAFAHQMAAAWRKAALLHDLASSLEELKQTQAQLVQAQKMEAIGRLAGGVAHDFNNLLTSIMGYADLLLSESASDDRVRGDVEQIRKSADRAAALTRQLLAFSRKQVLQPVVLDLNVVIADMEKMLRRLIGEDVDLTTVLRANIGRVKADPGQIEQVVMNLAINARDAMPHGGKLTVETANVDLDEEYARQHMDAQPGRYVMLAVSDTGIGMDRETQSHLFEPFFTTKERGRGTGLGLSTVYGIVRQSGGSIYVYSEPGQGTTFKAYLPRVDALTEVLQPSAAPAGLLRGSETILLVEDEEMVASLAKRILVKSGYTVLEAGDAGAGAELCQHHQARIDLLLTDVVLPGATSGPGLVRHMRMWRPNLRVLYVSGYTDNAIVHHGVLEPGVAFLQKPFTPEALARKVREVLDTPRTAE